MAITLKDVRAAARAIDGQIVHTPCLHSRTLSEVTGADVYLKFENLQFTASFKERGALTKLLSLTAAQRARGVITASAGNHAQGVAYNARRLGVPATVVMPRFTPQVKVTRTRGFGAAVVLHGDNFDAARTFALRLAAEREQQFVHPYDDELIIAGQGTIALEVLSAHPDLDVLVVPVGGGGLISGIAVAAKALRPRIRVIGVETARFPSMHAALRGRPAKYGTHTIADGIAVKQAGDLTLPIVRRLVDDIILLDESVIEEAIVMLLEIEKTVAEGAGAAALGALLRHRQRFAGKKVGLVISGGNVDPLLLADIIQRGLVRSGRLVRLCVDVSDLPGSLAQVTACVAAAGANIEEIHHQRAFTDLPPQSAEVEMVLQTRDRRHIARVIAALADAGFNASQRRAG
ncbi:MAG: threonine ammonia-lyase [Burkholderiales bacterium]